MESNADSRVLHQQQLLVIGFLGGIAFTALVLVLQEQKIFEVPEGPFSGILYFDILIVMIATTSSSCIFGSFAFTLIGAGMEPSKRFRTFAEACFIIGMIGLLVILPLLLVIFTSVGAFIVFIFELVMFYLVVSSFSNRTIS